MIPNQMKFFLDSKSCQQIKDDREYFFAMVSSCLLNESKYYAESDEHRKQLIIQMQRVADKDPEFILQVAYYVRNKMYIRTTSNLILAFAILDKRTIKYVKQYFDRIVLIPGDLIEVCKYVQVINSLEILNLKNVDIRKQFKFPKVLQESVQQKLKKFTLYQLGKQCSDGCRKKNIRKYQEVRKPELGRFRKEKRIQKLLLMKKQAEGDAQEQFQQKQALRTGQARKMIKKHAPVKNEIANTFDTNFLQLKDIVKFCHASEPKELVMSVLGCKYPKTAEECKFNKFDITKAGKRMSIPIPVTWDRELSKGKESKTQIWQDLLMNNQVPYLALLRNLRNILQAKVSQEAHVKVIQKLTNQDQVVNAKIFPLQFLSALETVTKINEPLKVKQKTSDKIEVEVELVDNNLIKGYADALENALRISVDKNLDTISGVTYILIDVSGSMGAKISGGKKYGSVHTCMDCGFILGQMIRMKCEQCRFFLFACPLKDKAYLEVDFGNDTLMQGIEKCQQESRKLSGSSEQIGQTIMELLLLPKIKADNIVILSDMMVTQGFCGDNQYTMDQVIQDYVKLYNDARFFFMDISSYGQQVGFGQDLKSKNCFIINGMSDNVLKYIAQAGQVNQIDDIKHFAQA